ncbi:MAG: hypothetical protein HY962_06515 [Ignavibacteriae bacterium]|nr:hypothetical protein [Ignavibacteriota bacterium]
MIMLAISDSLRIVELQQSVELLAHKLDSLGNHTKSFYDAMPTGIGWLSLYFGVATAFLIGLLVWNAIRATRIPEEIIEKLNKLQEQLDGSVCELEFHVGVAVLNTALTLVIQDNVVAFFALMTSGVRRLTKAVTLEKAVVEKIDSLKAAIDVSPTRLAAKIPLTELAKMDEVSNALAKMVSTSLTITLKVKELAESCNRVFEIAKANQKSD